MKIIFCSFFVFAIIHSGFAQYNSDNLSLESQKSYKFQKLQLYPVRANSSFVNHHRNLGKYLTLKEAMERNLVRITEVNSGDVNKLFLENVSSDTVMILSGEVVQGGKQDRMLAQDVILSPRSGKQDVDVFCVEQGRWTEKEDGRTFKKYYAISSNEVRKAGTVKKNQNEVWQKVAETTEKNNATTESKTLTALNGSAVFSNDLQKYTSHFQNLFSGEADIIGVVAASGSKIMGCDLFASHDLFRKHYPNLLNSYATEAITSGDAITVTPEQVDKYLQAIIADEKQQEQTVPKNGTMLKSKDKKVHISTF